MYDSGLQGFRRDKGPCTNISLSELIIIESPKQFSQTLKHHGCIKRLSLTACMVTVLVLKFFASTLPESQMICQMSFRVLGSGFEPWGGLEAWIRKADLCKFGRALREGFQFHNKWRSE